jgi:hypothetical protein
MARGKISKKIKVGVTVSLACGQNIAYNEEKRGRTKYQIHQKNCTRCANIPWTEEGPHYVVINDYTNSFGIRQFGATNLIPLMDELRKEGGNPFRVMRLWDHVRNQAPLAFREMVDARIEDMKAQVLEHIRHGAGVDSKPILDLLLLYTN